MTIAAVRLWGRRIGAVAVDAPGATATFEYDPQFARSRIELAPLQMPLRAGTFRFPALSAESFAGLPGLVADSLPDSFGNALIDAWLAREGRTPESFDAVERLCYVGRRGIGALEYEPAVGPEAPATEDLDVQALVQLASEVLKRYGSLQTDFSDEHRGDAIRDILQVGTSAGGARPKAVIAYNEQTQVVRSGHLDVEAGFEHWILKFDGVDAHREVGDALGYGAIEYAYAQMARAAGIEMSDCRLLSESGRRHFMTRRFDRPGGNTKLHMQSLAALAHLDFRQAGAHSYEQALLVGREIGLSGAAAEQLFLRMVFNVMARNQDDHVKNIAFLMDQSGSWALAPAYDMTYAYNPQGEWTSRHQMTIAGKRDGFTRADFEACARSASLRRSTTADAIEAVRAAVGRWREFADEARVDEERAAAIAATHRLTFA
jgi:serine/threonine-protein kinase HipA